MHQALLAVGKNLTPYSGHSFRIRVMSTATKRGVEDLLIKIFGCWKSAAAYQCYVNSQKVPKILASE